MSIVGAGPGDPEFLTIKGFKALRSADVILFDALLDPEYQSLFPHDAEAVYIGKRSHNHTLPQEGINEKLYEYAAKGYHVVRLKGGDPFLFGRGGEEALYLEERGIPFQIIPGVSALNGIGGNCGVPLTHRGISRKVMVLEGHSLFCQPHDWHYLARFDGTIVIFMAKRKCREVAKKLVTHGAREDLPICLIETTDGIQHTTFSNLKEMEHLKIFYTDGPGIIYIGEVVNLAHKLQTAEPQFYKSIATGSDPRWASLPF